MSIIKFLVGSGHYSDTEICCKVLLVTFKMKADEWVEVAELQSTQEQADTRFLLHVLHAAKTGSKAVTVTSEDTNVMLPCLAFQKDIHCPIYQKCGTQNGTRFVYISKLAWPLGDSVCDSLIGLHAFTGYDTVSAFASRGTLSSLHEAHEKGHNLPGDV